MVTSGSARTRRSLTLLPAQDARQPFLDGGAHPLASDNRERALDAGGNIGGETNLGAKGLGRTMFDPSTDDQQPDMVGCQRRQVPTSTGGTVRAVP